MVRKFRRYLPYGRGTSFPSLSNNRPILPYRSGSIIVSPKKPVCACQTRQENALPRQS